MEGLFGIGQLARVSGLTVSALRFYDGAGVLEPAFVDQHTGYRWYTSDQLVVAQLICRLRRTRMPLAAIRQVLADRHVPARVDSLLAAHVARLEQGLADARRELSVVRSLLNTRECPMTTTLACTGLNFRSALVAVRFAVSADPELPVLGGVLLDISDGVVNLVATDRYRLAVAPVTASVDGPDQVVVVPLAFADGIAAAEATQIHLTLDVETVTAQAGALTLTSSVINELFPDYRRLMPTDDPEAVSIGSDLREAITNGPSLPSAGAGRGQLRGHGPGDQRRWRHRHLRRRGRHRGQPRVHPRSD